ncbi:MAG: hypothetical protein ACLTZY_03435 [Alistipes indistinctus]
MVGGNRTNPVDQPAAKQPGHHNHLDPQIKGLQYKAVIVPYCTWELSPKRGSLLWAAADEAPFDALGEMPIRYKNEMGVSYFSEAFYRETVLAHIDNINIFYVAATQREEELHLMLHSGRQMTRSGD